MWPMSGDYVVVDGYRFNRFIRYDFDTFRVIDNFSRANNDLILSMKGREVQITVVTECMHHSNATVKLSRLPEHEGNEIIATFEVLYCTDKLAAERKPRGGYLECF